MVSVEGVDFAGACAGVVIEGEAPFCEGVDGWARDLIEVEEVVQSTVRDK